MTTTDANGIVFLQETDIISPFHTLINVLQSGTSEAITLNSRGPREVANNSERDALLAQYGSSAARPFWVSVNGVLMRHNGSGWKTILEDTGWLIPTMLNGWSSINSLRSARYRRINGVVYLRGVVSGGSTTSIFELPAGFRPEQNWRQLQQNSDSGTGAVSVLVNSTGMVAASTSSVPCFDGISFPADI